MNAGATTMTATMDSPTTYWSRLVTHVADWRTSDANLGDEAGRLPCAGGADARSAATAAPGAPRVPGSPRPDRRAAAFDELRRRRRWRAAAAMLMLSAGVALLAAGGWIHAKAWLAQVLIERAWDHNLQQGRQVAKPWGWADTTPVARLRFERQQREMIVLAGDSGRVLAFGPGHRDDTPLPGAAGNAVVSGHRDTHFALLRDVKIDDTIEVESLDGAHHRYRVDMLRIVDRSRIDIAADQGRDELTLVTCWPFDAAVPGGRWRLVVSARAVAAPAASAPTAAGDPSLAVAAAVRGGAATAIR